MRLTNRDREILLRAARRLWNHGCRGAKGRTSSGKIIDWYSPPAAQWCVWGALDCEALLMGAVDPLEAEQWANETVRNASPRLSSIALLNDERGPRAAARLLKEVARA